MAENKYGVELISGITPKNSGSFPLVHAKDVEMPDGTRLSSFKGGGDVTGLPSVTTADNGKILQVANGAWAVLALEDSAVKTYIDDYISTALGGDY